MKKIVLLAARLCLLIVSQSVFAFTEPQALDLTYTGDNQYLVTEGVGDSGNEGFYFWNDLRETPSWDDDLPVGHLPGKYTVRYILASHDEIQNIPLSHQKVKTITVTIKEREDLKPKAKSGLVYNGSKQTLVIPGEGLKGDVYYYRNPYWPDEATDKWTTTPTEATNPGTYDVEYYLAANGTKPSNNITGTLIRGIRIAPRGSFNPPSGNSGSGSSSGSSGHYSFYTIGDGYGLFESDKTLPATGFPTRFTKPLSVKPDTVRYEDLSMRIQIPSISVDVELTGVPEYENTWAVEWLDNQAGILSGSAMPGDGYTLVAAHNHLNTQEIGPFAFLFDLKENDRIFVNMPDDGLKMYSVYANELLEPNDFRQMAAISEGEEGSLILITCENEMIDGGYQNRRVVFAKLMN